MSFPTCQVRVVRFYVSRLSPSSFLLPALRRRAVRPQPRAATPVFPAGPPPRPSAASVLCRISTAIIRGQCSLPDLICEPLRPVLNLNCDLLCPVFLAGPQPRPSAASVPCRTSTASCCGQCSCRTSTATICAQCSLPDLNREIECQKICQKECQRIASSQSVCVERNRTHFRR